MIYNFDSELRPMIELLPAVDFSDPAAIRKQTAAMFTTLNASLDTTGVNIEDRLIRGPERAPDVAVRIYTPAELNGSTAGLIYIHGGGFAMGSLDSEHAVAIELCRDLAVVLVSVGYRLAPENPYPAGLEDCFASLCWTRDNAAQLSIDSERLGVIGNSAGGGLAAALALLNRDRQGPALCFQLLGMPELDDRLQTQSMQTFTDTPLWHRPNAILSWKFYLGEQFKPGDEDLPYYAAPARAPTDKLKGLPPAYVSTMEFDPLRDEGIEYALKMLQAGVNVELHSYPGTFHGSVMLPSAVSQRVKDELKVALRRGLGLADRSVQNSTTQNSPMLKAILDR